MLIVKRFLAASVFFILFISSGAVFAVSEEEETFLNMYFSDDELKVLSATRSLKSISRVAENIAVVTASDIELMNAHSIAQALSNVTGIEMWSFAGPGTSGYASIHGSGNIRVTVLLDGVPLRNEQHAVNLDVWPVQMIEKIEIVKGPASSVWGSSFGGVINIITKSPQTGNQLRGSLYAAGGEHNTSDLRAETYGELRNIGMYLYAGTMNSGGLVNNHDFQHDNVFAKLRFDAGERTRLDLSFFYHKGDYRQWDYLPLGYDIYHSVSEENIFSKACLTSNPHPDIDLNLSAWLYNQNGVVFEVSGAGERLWDANSNFNKFGFNGNLTWRAGHNTFVLGADKLEGRFKWSYLPGEIQSQREFAVYMNDTVRLGAFGATLGLRYDNTSVGGDFVSPSIGLTWLAHKDALVRASVSRGFHDPMLSDIKDSEGYIGNPDIRHENILSYQVGAETNIMDTVRAKITLFLHNIKDMIRDGSKDDMMTRVNSGRQRVTGAELDLSSKVFRGFTFNGGIHFEKIKNLDFSSDDSFNSADAYGLNTSLIYKTQGLRAMLDGNYMWWNLPAFWDANYNGFVVNFNVITEILKIRTTKVEAFLTAHNILNVSSYNDSWVKNPGRWFEMGLQYKF